MKHLDQQPAAVNSHTVKVLSVLVGCSEPMPGLGQHRVTLQLLLVGHMDVSATGIKGMPR
ncbi:hypothetical protein D3C76_1189860 [compost metagenome]